MKKKLKIQHLIKSCKHNRNPKKQQPKFPPKQQKLKLLRGKYQCQKQYLIILVGKNNHPKDSKI